MNRLELERSPAEGRDANGAGELCYSRALGRFTLWVQCEYAGAPWGWMVMEGDDAIAFGDGTTREDAERQLAAAVAELCPDLLPPAPPRPLLFGADGRPLELD